MIDRRRGQEELAKQADLAKMDAPAGYGSAASLLDRDMPGDYLSEWTSHISRPKTVAQAGTRSVVIFRIDREWLALPTGLFQEVVEQCTVRTLPHCGAVVRGLVSVRGELLVCVSLQALLGMESPETAAAQAPGTPGRVVILNRQAGRFAFQVSEVHGIHRYHPAELRTAPATLTKGSTPSYTAGMLQWNEKTVGCLAGDLILSALNKGLA